MNNNGFPSIVFSLDAASHPDVTIITYGRMLGEALKAADDLMMRDELLVNVIALTQLSPVPIDDIKTATNGADRIYVVEEGTLTGGIGAEIVAECVESGINAVYHRIAAPDMPIPNGLVLEKQIMPDAGFIAERIRG